MAVSHRSIHNLVDKILSKRRPRSDSGGYASATNEDIKDLYSLLYMLSAAKFETDVDGDLPLQFMIVNRKVEYHPALSGTLTHSREDEDGKISFEEVVENIRNCMLYSNAYLDRAKHLSEVLWLHGNYIDFNKRRELRLAVEEANKKV
jgi:hypothetical protein